MNRLSINKIFIYIPVIAILNGCVAVWDGSYQIKEKNQRGITIQYDSALNSSGMMRKMATNHCDKLNKIAEIQSTKMPGLLIGIIEEKYSCIEKITINIPEGYTAISTLKNESLYSRYDEFKDIKFIRHKYFFSWSLGQYMDEPIEIYEVANKNLRVIFNYYGADWIFFTKAVLISASGKKNRV